MEKLLKASELSEIIQVTPETILKLAKQGSLPCHMIGEQFRFILSEVLSSTKYNLDNMFNRVMNELGTTEQNEDNNYEHVIDSIEYNIRNIRND